MRTVQTLDELPAYWRVMVGAFAFSSALERILPALGFGQLRPADELPDRMPFYLRETATVEEARAALWLA